MFRKASLNNEPTLHSLNSTDQPMSTTFARTFKSRMDRNKSFVPSLQQSPMISVKNLKLNRDSQSLLMEETNEEVATQVIPAP